MNQGIRRIGYLFLCALPFLDLVVGGARPLRTSGVYPVIGVVLFTAVVIAAWVVGARVISVKDTGARKLALAGVLLILPWAIISLLWVGIGAPFQATLQENYMRFLVLVSNSIIVTSAFVVLKDALYHGGERFYSTLGFAASLAAGSTYLACLTISLAQVTMLLGGDKTPLPAIVAHLYSALEFVACIMTYVATAVFATALGRARFLAPPPPYLRDSERDPRPAPRDAGSGVPGNLGQHHAMVHAARRDRRNPGDSLDHTRPVWRRSSGGQEMSNRDR